MWLFLFVIIHKEAFIMHFSWIIWIIRRLVNRWFGIGFWHFVFERRELDGGQTSLPSCTQFENRRSGRSLSSEIQLAWVVVRQVCLRLCGVIVFYVWCVMPAVELDSGGSLSLPVSPRLSRLAAACPCPVCNCGQATSWKGSVTWTATE